MTRNKALEILGLSTNASEDEVKKTYRNLAKKYHPDNFIVGSLEYKFSEEKMKKINEAKNTLDNFFKNNSFDSQSYFELEKYKNNLINKLYKYKFKEFCPNDFEIYNNQIDSIIFWFKLEINIDFIFGNTKNKIDESYQEHLKLIFQILKEFKKEFFFKYEINEVMVKENINYENGIEDFYNQLLKIKEKYSLVNFYRKKLEEDLNDYKLRAGYNYLKDTIEIIINDILKNLKKNNYTNYEEELNQGKKEIEEIFEEYFKYLFQFNEILKMFESKNLEKNKIEEILKKIKEISEEKTKKRGRIR